MLNIFDISTECYYIKTVQKYNEDIKFWMLVFMFAPPFVIVLDGLKRRFIRKEENVSRKSVAKMFGAEPLYFLS